MGDAATAARLVAPACITLRAVTCQLCTAFGAVNLPSVAAAADDHLGAAGGTEEKTGRRVATIRSEPWDGCGRSRRWLECCPRMRARHGVGRGA